MNELTDKTVLLVDDDPGMLRAMEKVLKRAGMNVSSATWVREGIEQLTARAQPYDVVITDLRMPMASGVVIMQAVHTAFPRTPVIIMTAYNSPEKTEGWWIEQGAAAYLQKPIESGRLLETVRRVMQEAASAPA